MRRPLTPSASINISGPWQIAAIGFPDCTNDAKFNWPLIHAKVIWVHLATWKHQRVIIAAFSLCLYASSSAAYQGQPSGRQAV